MVLAVAHAIVEHYGEIARHHGAQANAVARVADVGRHPFVQTFGNRGGIGVPSRDLVCQRLDPVRRHCFLAGFHAIGLRDLRIVREGGERVAGIALDIEHRVAKRLRLHGLAIAPGPLHHLATSCRGPDSFAHPPCLVLHCHRLGHVYHDAHIAIVERRTEALDHGKVVLEHWLQRGQAVGDERGVAYGQLGKHDCQRAAVGVDGRVAVLPSAGHHLEITGGYVYPAAVRLERVSLEHIGLLDAGAVGHRIVLE